MAKKSERLRKCCVYLTEAEASALWRAGGERSRALRLWFSTEERREIKALQTALIRLSAAAVKAGWDKEK